MVSTKLPARRVQRVRLCQIIHILAQQIPSFHGVAMYNKGRIFWRYTGREVNQNG